MGRQVRYYIEGKEPLIETIPREKLVRKDVRLSKWQIKALAWVVAEEAAAGRKVTENGALRALLTRGLLGYKKDRVLMEGEI